VGKGGFRCIGLLNLNVWVRVMMMRELMYWLQWLSLKELSREEGSFSICQKMNKKINKKMHKI
jgi:hypothetical protein